MDSLIKTIKEQQINTLIKEQTNKLQLCTNELELKVAENLIIRDLLKAKEQKCKELSKEIKDVKIVLKNTFTEAN